MLQIKWVDTITNVQASDMIKRKRTSWKNLAKREELLYRKHVPGILLRNILKGEVGK